MDSRAEFESFISLPPHEKEISRFPEDGSSAWPGSYKNLIVDLAWETWQASRQSGDGCLHTGTLTVDHHKNDPAMQNVDYAHADGVLEPGVYKLYTHPASAERPSLGQRKADQVGTTIGVLVQTPAGSVAAVTDLGRCTWLNQDVTGAGDEVSVPTHALVYEYDGAVQCLHCGAQWGALPGNPTEPVHCAPAKGGEAVSVPKQHTPEVSGNGQRGICAHCQLGPTKDGHDGCMGELPASVVMNACCGHGEAKVAYVQTWWNERISGERALAYIAANRFGMEQGHE